MLERTVEQIGPHGRDEPHVDRLVTEHLGSDGEEGIALLLPGARPALLELVDDDDHATGPPGHVGERAGRRFGRVGVGHRCHLAQRGIHRVDGVIARNHRGDDGAGRAQPGNEPGEDHRRLPGSRRSDDGHEPVRRHQRREVGDDAVATVERPCVGLVEGAQPAVRVDSRSRCLREVAGGDPPSIGRYRAGLRFAVPDSGPPCQHELGHALVAISDGPLQDGIETVGHPRHPPDEARNAIGPRRPACRGRRSGRARSAEQFPGHPAETSDVGGDDVTGSVGRVGDAEVGQVGGACVVEQHVGCLHVVVRHTGTVGGHQCRADLFDQA